MEIVLQTKKKVEIARTHNRTGGIIRIDEEACQVLEGILGRLQSNISVRESASTLIKEAANNLIIKEER